MSRGTLTVVYSFKDSFKMLNKLQKMAIEEGNINLALKAEELKCKLASLQANTDCQLSNEHLTKILVDFINERENSTNTGDICPADTSKEEV
ncbi:MAG: hypothetical protein IJ525_06650 [Alphaproteobacteria bacterium]|nr:hypothetical protein [Alphaproteobacteria bacterium]MBR3501687.1 hypothetical protein [Alphaproteobacteria bacterium]